MQNHSQYFNPFGKSFYPVWVFSSSLQSWYLNICIYICLSEKQDLLFPEYANIEINALLKQNITLTVFIFMVVYVNRLNI